jgi:hypothetical protein
MRLTEHLPKILIVAVLLGGIVLIVSDFVGGPSGGLVVEVRLPALSPQAREGQSLFAETCAACHGENAAGSEQGPPLIHDTYNPGHHGDEAFFVAVSRGTPSHHWQFGDMPPIPDVSIDDIEKIVRFIRETQLANGITYRPHRM